MFVVVGEQPLPDDLENGDAEPIEHNFSLVSIKVPNLHSGLQTVASAVHCEKPLYQENLRLDFVVL